MILAQHCKCGGKKIKLYLKKKKKKVSLFHSRSEPVWPFVQLGGFTPHVCVSGNTQGCRSGWKWGTLGFSGQRCCFPWVSLRTCRLSPGDSRWKGDQAHSFLVFWDRSMHLFEAIMPEIQTFFFLSEEVILDWQNFLTWFNCFWKHMILDLCSALLDLNEATKVRLWETSILRQVCSQSLGVVAFFFS